MKTRELISRALRYLGNEEMADNLHRVILGNTPVDPMTRQAACRVYSTALGLPLRFIDHATPEARQAVLAGYISDDNFATALTRNFALFATRAATDDGCLQAFARYSIEPERDFFEFVKRSTAGRVKRRYPGATPDTGTTAETPATYKAVSYFGAYTWDEFLGERKSSAALFDARSELTFDINDNWSTVLYTLLITAAQLSPVIAHDATGTTKIERVIKTINKAIGTIQADLKNEVGVNAAGPWLLYVNPDAERMSYLTSALSYSQVNSTTSEVSVSYRPTVIPTYKLVDSTGATLAPKYGVLVYPGRRIGYADKRLPGEYPFQDVLTLSRGLVKEHSFAAGVDDPRQIRIVELHAA